MLNTTEREQIERFATQLKKRWSIGDAGAVEEAQLPPSWRPLLQGMEGAQRRLSLLALLGQCQQFLYRPTTPELSGDSDLPRLSCTTLPDRLRPAFRRLLEQNSIEKGSLLQLMARRGYGAHPADWLPDSGAGECDLPELYAPWLRWVSRGIDAWDDAQGEVVPLSESSWEDYAPAERLALFVEMRRRVPTEARELLRIRAQSEPAERRLRLLESMKINLGPEDADYLRSLEKDRSQKVRLVALQLLSRLGAVDAGPEAIEAEDIETDRLSEGFQVKKTGLLKRGLAVVPSKLKTGKQRSLRLEQLSTVTFQQFAGVLDISAQELASGWRFSGAPLEENIAFVERAQLTATEPELAALLENLLGGCPAKQLAQLLLQLRDRLSREQKHAAFERLQRTESLSMRDWEIFFRGDEREFSWEALGKSHAGRELLVDLKKEIRPESYLDDHILQWQLNALALLLDREGAESSLETLTGLGLVRTDAALELLKFNAQL